MSSCCKEFKTLVFDVVYRIKTFIFHLVVPGEYEEVVKIFVDHFVVSGLPLSGHFSSV